MISDSQQFTPNIGFKCKLKIKDPVVWEHHRGGWKFVIALLTKYCHSDDGILFLSSVEDVIALDGAIEEPWVGVLHQAPRTTYEFPDLFRLLQTPAWKASVENCQGIFTLSNYVREFLQAWNVSVPISVIPYPVEFPEQLFSLTAFHNNHPRKLVFIGEYLRDYRSFFNLDAPGYQKILLKPDSNTNELLRLQGTGNVEIAERLTDIEYDRLLAESLVFLSLYDAVGITTIMECIARGTPILINKLPGTIEYLGIDYPLYFDSLAEATAKLCDDERISDANNYLLKLETRSQIKEKFFLNAFCNSAIYRSLLTPNSQKDAFRTYDLTIMICVHSRVNELENLLERLSAQKFDGNFEVILWNNNIQEYENVRQISEPFCQRLHIKLIHSSENYYCIVRFAVASLMQSELLLIIDDDVIPAPDYINRFISKYSFYGPDTAICARGHIFLPHELNEEEPNQVWQKHEDLLFYDESTPDCRIHFMHADNCLIPKRILKEAIAYDMERYEFALIDDYWLSFVLGHYLKIPVWKIQAEDVLSFTESSEDPKIAMYMNPEVMNERVNFYVYHMRAGWPEFTE